MGEAASVLLKQRVSHVRLPHGKLDDLFYIESRASEPQPSFWWWLRSTSPAASSSVCHPSGVEQLLRSNRVLEVKDVYWCSEPLKEAGPFQHLSPRTPLRLRRILEGKVGPSSREIGHSYVVMTVLVGPESPAQPPRTEMWRLSWGQGIVSGTNLVVQQASRSCKDNVSLPPARIKGDRQERSWPATCSPGQLLDLLKKWDGQEYDVNPTNSRNCHHFVQDVLKACTRSPTGESD